MRINRELAPWGIILKAISPLGSERAQRLLGPLSAGFMRWWPVNSLHGTKETIPRPDGSTMRVCILRGEKTEGPTVGVLWLHGGGYVLGAPEMAVMSFPRQLIKNTNCVVVAPDYTLSCKAPYPAALEDAYTALQWLKKNRSRLGIDGEKLVVGGESAGGGLTAALCLYAREKGDDCIGVQLPLYPMLDDRVTPTSAKNTAPVWNTKANLAAWRIYLGDRVMNNGVPATAAPARATSLDGLPPAITVIGTAEPFYDETLTYFRRLEEAGVPTALKEVEGAFHAFDMLAPAAAVSRASNAFLLEAFRRFTAQYI